MHAVIKFKNKDKLIVCVIPDVSVAYEFATMPNAEWVNVLWYDGGSAITPIKGPEPHVCPSWPVGMTIDVLDNVAEFLADNKKISAIKEVRNATKCTLAEAKNVVDKLVKDNEAAIQWYQYQIRPWHL